MLEEQVGKAASRYIKSVIVIDNELYINDSKDSAHPLNAGDLAEYFSKESIACSIYRPNEDSDPVEICTSLVRQSDVAIIDWQLAKEGDKAGPCKRIIREVLEKDNSEGNPLRLIVVYTGESLTDNLVDELKRGLEGFDVSTLEADDGFGLLASNVRIVFVGKSNGGASKASEDFDPAQGGGGVRVDLCELPDLVINEFKKLSLGILPAAALNAVSALRERSHVLLSAFRKELDPAFVFHAAIIPNPEDSKGFLVQQIADEARTILEHDGNLSDCLQIPLLCDWVSKNNPFTVLSKKKNPIENSSREIAELLKTNDPKKETEHIKGSRRFSMYQDKDVLSEFSRLTSACLEADSPFRPLPPDLSCQLCHGTVLKRIGGAEASENGSFFLNILPACDTVRRTGISGFPLLKLQEWNSDEFHPDICLLDGCEPVYLAIPSDKQWDCVSVVSFNADEGEQCVVANREDEGFVFIDNSGDRYQWIAELKSSMMLSIQQMLFPKMIRIGVDEFDWLRNNRGKRQ